MADRLGFINEPHFVGGMSTGGKNHNFFGEYLKDKVYVCKSTTIVALKTMITGKFRRIPAEICKNVMSNLER